MSNLAQRILSAVILIPIVLGVLLYAPTGYFALLMGFFMVGGAWEWGTLAGWTRSAHRLGFVALVVALMLSVWWGKPGWVMPLAGGLGVVWWAIALVSVLSYQRYGQFPSAIGHPIVAVLVGIAVLVPAWASLVYLQGQEDGRQLVLFLLVLIWAADTGAYFAGRRFGRLRLAARVSPGKTWEGFAGGMLLVLVVSIIYGNLDNTVTGAPTPTSVPFVILCVLTGAVSVLGDLTESAFKRRVDVKDSGRLIPGHGGVLDRIDSLTAAAPVFMLGFLVIVYRLT